MRIPAVADQGDLFLYQLPLLLHPAHQHLVLFVVDALQAVFAVSGGKILQQCVQPRHKPVIRIALQLLFNQALSCPAHNAGIVDNPGISLQAMNGEQGKQSGKNHRHYQDHGNKPLLHDAPSPPQGYTS